MKFIKRSLNHLKWMLDKVGFFNCLSDEAYLKFCYRFRIGKKLNLDTPKTFNEKIQWLKINDRNPKYIKMVDKFEAKSYVESIIGSEYIIPTYGVYDSFKEIDFEKLPKRFVIKCTHNSGGVVVVQDKEKIDKDKLAKKFKKMLHKNFFYVGREWPYKSIKPRIIVEKNIQDEDSDEQINDYKIMCFNGNPKCSFVCSNRNSKDGLCVNFYDYNWNPLPFERHYPRNKNEIKKPSQYDKMIKLSKKLSREIPFVRVDFYQKGEQIYFGELTFYPGSGMEEFTPDEWDEKLGEWLELPKKKMEEI